ncbi:MAG: bifunctional ADP-dependent NAD(P)H-hydrate dehydratase/NAD(P)H-hydrate epimerase [Treponema sp.]|jgi:NAD(P)H-hydrate epimerase|nr:bifunctional ADP-dependent NAD(P)H-hydrate dehydratase/NAD(P)H-hydrate epimerase [Treponema sp.]
MMIPLGGTHPPGLVKLVTAETARALDEAASSSWGLNPFALVEAAGRSCAAAFIQSYPAFLQGPSPRILVLAGTGNNAADAMVMLRALLMHGFGEASSHAVVLHCLPNDEECSPRAEALKALNKLGVSVFTWKDIQDPQEFLRQKDIIIDGIAGTGLTGPLRGTAAAMVQSVNALTSVDYTDYTKGHSTRPLVVSIDLPSGNFDSWEQPMLILKADISLALEPVKAALYNPPARPYGGTIVQISGIFPQALIKTFEGGELLSWEQVRYRIPSIKPDAYKHQRGLVEIHAGSPGSTGAARIAAAGAQAAGAGLVRLIVDTAIYPVLAASAGGVMVVPAGIEDSVVYTPGQETRFYPDALLLGPGWGKTADRTVLLHRALVREWEGIPLILDADAISLAKDGVFHGNAILTPHPGECAALAGVSIEAVLAHPGPLLKKLAQEKQAVILFKGHVLFIACPDGRLGVVDGMIPALATGGAGDLLAGFCAAIAARMKRNASFDGYTCALAAATLLMETGRSTGKRFIDPLGLAEQAAVLAGTAWLTSLCGSA